MTSPCETATQSASGPWSRATAASVARMARMARSCISAIDSPGNSSLSGKRAALGWSCTIRQSGSRARSFSAPPVHAP